MTTQGEFDTIIVGAGSAGCVLAARLSEAGQRVLLLEAGGSDRRFWVQVPIGYAKTFNDAQVNWRYETEPVPLLAGRRSYWPRGKVLGGSSSINAMVYVRGHPGDFDDWAQAAPGWGWDNVAPVFQRMERWSEGADNHRGGTGPLRVTDVSAQMHPLCERYLAAAEAAGIERNPDYNGAMLEGAFSYQLTVGDGRRASTARCYLRPALRSGGNRLRVTTHALVTHVLFEGRRAIGVAYTRGGREHEVRAQRNVILAGGAVNSPQLLMLSGVGPGETLREHGIPVVHANDNVGQHLQDHLGVNANYHCAIATLNQTLGTRMGRLRAGVRYLLTRRGPLSLSVNQGGAFVRSREGLSRPDMQVYFSPITTRPNGGADSNGRPQHALLEDRPGYLLGYSPCRPTSTGHLTLRSAHPADAPAIHPNYLATESDREDMRAGMRLMRRLAASPALADVTVCETAPGETVTSDAALDAYIREHAWTVYHPCGTCRMGADAATSVVDPELRVHGVEGLRVVDASAFPNVTSGNINAPTIMLAERASELIALEAV